jgi:hypothetical protein
VRILSLSLATRHGRASGRAWTAARRFPFFGWGTTDEALWKEHGARRAHWARTGLSGRVERRPGCRG